MYISRKEAVETLYGIINSGIISEELDSKLTDIAQCIGHEEDNLFLWGADDEASDLFVLKREDLITPEWIKHCEDLHEKYKIREVEPVDCEEE